MRHKENASRPGQQSVYASVCREWCTFFEATNFSHLIIDQNDRVGDNWRKRYHQLVLHDPVWYDHMPYLPFPAQWPVFTPKDKLADFFVAYASLLELNVWTSTSLGESAKWDESKKCWEVVVVTDKVDEDGGLSRNKTVLHPRHIIQATGHSGKKNQP